MIYFATSGVYSDFTVLGIYEGPAGVDIDALVAAYAVLFPEQAEDYQVNEEQLAAYIAEQAGLTRLDAQELHLGSYGCLPKRLAKRV